MLVHYFENFNTRIAQLIECTNQEPSQIVFKVMIWNQKWIFSILSRYISHNYCICVYDKFRLKWFNTATQDFLKMFVFSVPQYDRMP